MTKSQFFAKVDTFRGLANSGLLPIEQLKASVALAIQNKEIKPLKEDAFAEKPAEVLEFARSIGLVKVPRGDGGQTNHTPGNKSDIAPLVEAQYPEVYAKLKPAMELAGSTFDVEVDGRTEKVAYQPFWRRIKPKKEKVDAGTSQAGQVAI